MIHIRSNLVGLGALVVVLAPLSGNASDITISDGSYFGGNWEVTWVESGGGGTYQHDTILIGGNPGEFSRTRITLTPANMPPSAFVWQVNKRVGFACSPSAHGSITSIDYSEDVKLDGACYDISGLSTGVVIDQAGQTYVSGGTFTNCEANWTERSLPSLQASDFILLDLETGAWDVNSHPDFSTSGADIGVGFYRESGTNNSSERHNEIGFDNWTLTIHGPSQCDAGSGGSTFIVNIDSLVNGTPYGNGTPCESGPHPTQEVAVKAGDYRITMVNPSLDPEALYTAWRHNSAACSWRTDWRFAYEDDSAGSGGVNALGFCTVGEAFAGTPTLTKDITVPTDQTLRFYVPDNIICDNSGGVSLRVTRLTAPIPTLPPFALAFLAVLFVYVGARAVRAAA